MKFPRNREDLIFQPPGSNPEFRVQVETVGISEWSYCLTLEIAVGWNGVEWPPIFGRSQILRAGGFPTEQHLEIAPCIRKHVLRESNQSGSDSLLRREKRDSRYTQEVKMTSDKFVGFL